jgi:hypothetical protein
MDRVTLAAFGIARSHHNPCLYVKGFSDGTTIDLAL